MDVSFYSLTEVSFTNMVNRKNVLSNWELYVAVPQLAAGRHAAMQSLKAVSRSCGLNR